MAEKVIASEDKKGKVRTMFNSIAGRYDFLNRLLSAGMDIRWRRKAVDILSAGNPHTVLDVATGTGDLAIAALRSGAEQIIGIDISPGMLVAGRKKISGRNLENRIQLLDGDSEDIPFPDNAFDAVMVAFGVRNFANLHQGLSEMCRVLKPGGAVVILEFSKPSRFPVKQLYGFYFRNVLPLIGKIISGDSQAYTYLPHSVYSFPEGDAFLAILSECGFNKNRQQRLTAGIASIYHGVKG